MVIKNDGRLTFRYAEVSHDVTTVIGVENASGTMAVSYATPPANNTAAEFRPISFSDTTPPSVPVVIDDGAYTSTATILHATWSSSDAETGVAEYQCAIGTTPGGTNVVPWTSVGAATEVTRTNLSLTNGTTYYFSVKARNGGGLLSSVGVSDGITVDVTPPTAIIASPTEGQVIRNEADIPFIGTATDANFRLYRLKYHLETSPGTWVLLKTSSNPVVDNVLATVNWQLLSNSIYTFRLEVEDLAGNLSVADRVITIDRIQITNVTISPRLFNPATGWTQIRFTLNRAAGVVLKAYPFIQVRESSPPNRIQDADKDQPVRTIHLGNLPAGPNVASWDGRDDAGILVSPETYGVRFEASDPDGSVGSYDPAYVWGEVAIQNPSTSQLYDPYRNIPLLITYTIPVDAWITLKAGKIGELVERARILWGVAQPAGTHTKRWDGRGDDGRILTRSEFDQTSLDAILLPESAVVIQGPGLDIPTFSVDGFVLFPTYRQVATLAFETTRDAPSMGSDILPFSWHILSMARPLLFV